MTIGSNINVFYGKKIEQFDQKSGVVDSSKAIRLSIGWESYEAGGRIIDCFQALLKDPKCAEIGAIIIGEWDGAAEGETIQELVDALVKNTSQVPALEAIFFGEMTYEESEISWINQANYSALWQAMPNLRHFQVRGGEGLELGAINHRSLKSLIVETGGLPQNIIDEVSHAKLPSLEHLELWLGDDGYGWGSKISDLAPLLSNEKFPQLKTLALRNSMETDELAKLLANSEFITQLEILDISLGTLGSDGAQAFLTSQYLKNLKKLDLHHHYIPEDIVKKLSALPFEVDTSDSKDEEEDGDRYVSVSE